MGRRGVVVRIDKELAMFRKTLAKMNEVPMMDIDKKLVILGKQMKGKKLKEEFEIKF